MGSETSMAISSYLGFLILLLVSYPFVIVGICVAVFDKRKHNPLILRFSLFWGVIVLGLLTMHLQTEVIYGEEIIEQLNNLE
ncbi:hypothetical protein KP803_06610 [Vibrio sp. ZSDE26]|uniref:Uncharacterized protein n=1 Tax=Vibrio amylolyticus TaxID=2847292 RepID=A0A9X1XHB3_9VIBR|nr:hypothetical protein [Vibrio amylolyticus]MCK6262949.1 hypothetical protein [Vibrio amylolyticus]